MAKSEEAYSPLEDVFVVDNDVHIEEPPELIAKYIDSPYAEAVERYKDVYKMRDTVGYMPGMKIGNVFRQAPTERSRDRPDLTDGRETEKQLKDLHVDVGVLFGENILKLPVIPDVDYAVALARAYNDFMLDRFLDESDMLVGALTVAPQDPQAAAEEIDRVGDEEDMKAVFCPVGGVDRTYGHPQYEPVWEAAVDNDLPIAFHSVGIEFPEFPFNFHKLPYIARHTMAHELALMVNAIDLVSRGVPVKYPELDFAFLEGGLSWMPMVGQRLDREYMQHREQMSWLEKRPSKYVDDFYIGTHPIETPEDSEDIVRLLDLVNGAETAMFATDWPHHDWDDTGEIQDLPVSQEVKEAIWGGNSAEFYDL